MLQSVSNFTTSLFLLRSTFAQLFISFLLINSIFAQTQEAYNNVEQINLKKQQCLNENQRANLKKRLKKNKNHLLNEGFLKIKNNSIVILDWPLQMISNQQFKSYYTISNYVDHNPNVGSASFNQFGSTNLDYDCGNRTYDTNGGYNHQGIDISLWPFEWYQYENSIVEVVAAAAGTIIGIDDGNVDNNCSCSGNWNAVYIAHADGSEAWYGHLKKNALTSKTVGQTVAKGEYLGIVASSGCSTGPHLHFELYDAMDNLIDPFSGACNSLNTSSWWSNQQAYRVSTLNALLTHSAVPVQGCSNTEVPSFANCFNPGQTIYTAFYYRDQLSGDVTNMRLRDPNNNVWNSWTHTSPGTYSGSWWYWSWNLPSSGPYGTWTLEADYKGTTSTYEFSYSNNLCSCPLSYSYSNGNHLTGTVSSNANYETFGMIESDQKITNGNSVIYDSGTKICLDNGFEIELGAIFEIKIDGCGGQ